MQLLLISILSCFMLIGLLIVKTRIAVYMLMVVYVGLIGFINMFFEDKK